MKIEGRLMSRGSPASSTRSTALTSVTQQILNPFLPRHLSTFRSSRIASVDLLTAQLD